MVKIEFEQRTLQFSRRIVALVNDMGENRTGACIRNQMLRSGTSIGANYREAQRAESRQDFLHKIQIAAKEASETLYWLELVNGTTELQSKDSADLQREASELLAILTTIGRKIKQTL